MFVFFTTISKKRKKEIGRWPCTVFIFEQSCRWGKSLSYPHFLRKWHEHYKPESLKAIPNDNNSSCNK